MKTRSESWMSEMPLANWIMPMESGPREEVCENVVHTWAMYSPNGEVVAQRERVELA
jgi:hypothetical protein